MAETYVIDGNADKSVSNVERLVLSKNEDGSENKVVSTTEPAELTKDEIATAKSFGIEVKKVNKDEANEIQKVAVNAPEAQAPVIGSNNPANKN